MNKMSIEDFDKQVQYCRENNIPEGCGCVGCPGEFSVCADNVVNLCGKLKERANKILMEE